MCVDKDSVLCDMPTEHLDLVMKAYEDMRRDPSNHVKFESFDWVFRVAVARWEAYSLARRIAAA
jgi:hypothetical protein